jgi:hypothetical protein
MVRAWRSRKRTRRRGGDVAKGVDCFCTPSQEEDAKHASRSPLTAGFHPSGTSRTAPSSIVSPRLSMSSASVRGVVAAGYRKCFSVTVGTPWALLSHQLTHRAPLSTSSTSSSAAAAGGPAFTFGAADQAWRSDKALAGLHARPGGQIGWFTRTTPAVMSYQLGRVLTAAK